MSFRRVEKRQRRSTRLVAVFLYSLVLAGSAFEHHDILCHLKNPQHCTACTASQLGSDPQPLAAPVAARLADAGRAVDTHATVASLLLAVSSTGRSPPLSI